MFTIRKKFSLIYTARDLKFARIWLALLLCFLATKSSHTRLGDAGTWGLQNGGAEASKQTSLKKSISFSQSMYDF